MCKGWVILTGERQPQPSNLPSSRLLESSCILPSRCPCLNRGGIPATTQKSTSPAALPPTCGHPCKPRVHFSQLSSVFLHGQGRPEQTGLPRTADQSQHTCPLYVPSINSPAVAGKQESFRPPRSNIELGDPRIKLYQTSSAQAYGAPLAEGAVLRSPLRNDSLKHVADLSEQYRFAKQRVGE